MDKVINLNNYGFDLTTKLRFWTTTLTYSFRTLRGADTTQCFGC